MMQVKEGRGRDGESSGRGRGEHDDASEGGPREGRRVV